MVIHWRSNDCSFKNKFFFERTISSSLEKQKLFVLWIHWQLVVPSRNNVFLLGITTVHVLKDLQIVSRKKQVFLWRNYYCSSKKELVLRRNNHCSFNDQQFFQRTTRYSWLLQRLLVIQVAMNLKTARMACLKKNFGWVK